MSFLFRWGSSSSPRDPHSDQQQQQQQQSPPAPSPAPPQVSEPEQETQTPRPLLTPNLKLLFGGIGFFLLSTVVTRRALERRHLAAIPPFYTGSMYHRPPVNGALEAFEALNIATINVVSLAMIGAGATLYALDINSLEDARRLARRGLGGDGAGTEKEVEELKELEQWVASVLGGKVAKEMRRREKGGEYGDDRKK